ncbi:MAG: endonuclease III [Desulfobacca sp.]|jgi:endonuclease-3|nr:endonuclease III [Desulfobacca sp.]
MDLEEKIAPILQGLNRVYPRSHTALFFKNPLEILIATILSAQCTDKRVNQVTQVLFKKYTTARDYAEGPLAVLEEDIRSTGFYHNKAKNIQECCRELIKKYRGEVPRTMEELVSLPGIGRKTANVVLGNAYGIPGVVVDTHVGRISQRLGLTREKDPVKIEFALMPLIPKKQWILFSLQLIDHGRSLCTARAPKCPSCFLLSYCDFGRMTESGQMAGKQ